MAKPKSTAAKKTAAPKAKTEKPGPGSRTATAPAKKAGRSGK